MEPDRISVDQRQGSTHQAISWPTAWTRLRVDPGPSHWYSPRLFLVYAGKQQEIGVGLNDEEKQQLMRSLLDAGLSKARNTRS